MGGYLGFVCNLLVIGSLLSYKIVGAVVFVVRRCFSRGVKDRFFGMSRGCVGNLDLFFFSLFLV